jgi:hypothetical protein
MDDRRIQIAAGSIVVTASLNDSPTADLLWEALPIEGSAELWGDEIYFDIPVYASIDPEWAAETVEFGAVGFWPPGSALCLFFGPTPMSRGDEIRPASPVNVLGDIEGDPVILKRVRSGAPILVERI